MQKKQTKKLEMAQVRHASAPEGNFLSTYIFSLLKEKSILIGYDHVLWRPDMRQYPGSGILFLAK